MFLSSIGDKLFGKIKHTFQGLLALNTHRNTEQTDKQMLYQTDSLHLWEAILPFIHPNQIHSISHTHTHTKAGCTHVDKTQILAALLLAPPPCLGFSLALSLRLLQCWLWCCVHACVRVHLRRKKPLKRKNNGQNNGNTETLMSEEIATSKGRCTIIRST